MGRRVNSLSASRTTLAQDAADEHGARIQPFLLGLALTPLGAVVGAFVALSIAVSGSGGGPGDTFVRTLAFAILFGLMFGLPFALPVTLILFPLMHRLGLPAWAYPFAGGGAGLIFYGSAARPAFVAGVVTGLVFAFAYRARPSPEGTRSADGAGTA